MIIPAKGRLLIKKLERQEIIAESGVYLPGQTLQEEQLFYGEIVGIANTPSDEFKDFPYKTGDKVWYSRYSSTKVVDDTGAEFLIVSDLDVMAYDTPTTRE
jgi:co-chaperonin GroES (HSP10)